MHLGMLSWSATPLHRVLGKGDQPPIKHGTSVCRPSARGCRGTDLAVVVAFCDDKLTPSAQASNLFPDTTIINSAAAHQWIGVPAGIGLAPPQARTWSAAHSQSSRGNDPTHVIIRVLLYTNLGSSASISSTPSSTSSWLLALIIGFPPPSLPAPACAATSPDDGPLRMLCGR